MKCSIKFVLALSMMLMAANHCQADTLYEADFGSFVDGPLAGQDGWEAQMDWTVSGGVVQNAGSWQRARRLGDEFTMAAGDVVRMTVEFSLDGTPGTGNQLALFGIAKSNENTGNNMPQVGAGIVWDGTELSVGGATDPNYDPGDVIQAALTFTRNADINSWSATSRITNVNDGTMFEAGFAPVDTAGSVTTETCWEWLDAGSSALFGIRNLDNSSGATLNVSALLLENNLPPDTPIAEVIYEADFATFDTDFLAGQDGWEAQAAWVVTGGMANTDGSWARARNLSPFTMAVDDQIRITAEMSFTGTPGPADFYSIGFAKVNEDTGNNTPQVEGAINWQGTNLSIGGAMDTGYDSGDAVTLTLLFTRDAAVNTWTLETMIDNTTDGTCFSGAAAPVDDMGSITPETAWEWFDTGGTGYFGMRMLDNSGAVVTAMDSVLVEKNPPNGDEPMVLLGDINLDGVVNLLDVEPFVSLITNSMFQAEGDINQDDVVNLLDVGPFVDILTGN